MEFRLSYFKSWRMILWKCCTQNASKFRKLSSGHRTGKGQFSFQSQRKAMPKNAYTTAQLHSSHTLKKWCSKFSKPGFNSMWTMNFQMFKLDFKKAEEPEIKLPPSAGSWKKQESSRKTSISALLTMPKPLTVWITTNWKILKEMEIPDHLTCLLRNLYAGQEATIRTRNETMDWFKSEKGVWQCCILSSCLFNVYAEYIMQNSGLDEAQIGIKTAGRNNNNLRYIDDMTLMAECKEELKSLLMKVKEESEKAGLKLAIQKIKIMASCPVTSWLIGGEKVKTVADFIILASKIILDGDYSHEIKRRLLLGRKAMTNISSILKSREINCQQGSN